MVVLKALRGKEITPESIEKLQEKLLFDRYPKSDRLSRFFILLFLSTIIATYGLLAGSVASIIGAMIVAPLMTPIMALSLGIATGDAKNIVRSFLIVVSGAAFTVLASFMLTEILIYDSLIANNSEILSRTTPGLIDLIIAFAAGCAGAFAIGREDVSDALPGVAIAVSLVPPLGVVGICLAVSEPAKAWGAFILFMTNFVSIAGAGLMIFAIMGYGGGSFDYRTRKAKRMATAALIASAVIITLLLGAASYRAAQQELLQRRVLNATSTWLYETGYEEIEIRFTPKAVYITIAGEGDLPSYEALSSDVEEDLGNLELKIRVVPLYLLD